MPNSPTLMNAGRENGTLSACFVLDLEDSVDGIMATASNACIIQKSGGGVGFSVGRLRAEGDRVSSYGGIASGPVRFLRVISEATAAVQTKRRGANMGVMPVDHPDVIKFIKAKDDLSQLTNFNLSVDATDQFMHQVLESPDREHQVRNPRTGEWQVLKKTTALFGKWGKSSI